VSSELDARGLPGCCDGDASRKDVLDGDEPRDPVGEQPMETGVDHAPVRSWFWPTKLSSWLKR